MDYKNLTVKDLHAIADFKKIVMNYLKMARLIKRDMEETPAEKATRLGVKVIEPVIRPIPDKKQPDKDDEAMVKMKAYMFDTVAVCGGCGKEIRRIDVPEPCGRQNCPFGLVTFS